MPVSAGQWDDEIYVGEALSSGTLSPNGVLEFSKSVKVPGGTEGKWRWKVKTNWRGEVFEGVNWYNNSAEAADTMQLYVPSLTVDVVCASSYTGSSSVIWYKFTQPAGSELAVYLDSFWWV